MAGELYIYDSVCPVTHQLKRGETYETKSCQHCQAVIVVLRRGCTTEWTAKGACSRCRGPLCRSCAERYVTEGCDGGIAAKVEHALKTGKWNGRYRHRYSVLPS